MTNPTYNHLSIFDSIYAVPAPIVSLISAPFRFIRRMTYATLALQNRERIRLWNEMNQIRGLLPLLMKQRNGYRWTALDRKRIKIQLQKLVDISPYLVLFVAPGGFLVLPVLAWWLDKRQVHPEAKEITAEQSEADAGPEQLLR